MTSEPEPKRGSTFPPPAGGAGTVFPPRAGVVRNSETVINVERRAAAEPPVELPAPSSTICGVLFPNPEALLQSFPNPAGIELGHFRIESAIRSGGMGAVFHAIDTRLNRPVALKILPPSLSRDLSSVQRFRNEAQAAAQLDHDNIARVFFIGEDKGLHFIAFEFIRGTNLREIVQQRGKLTPAEAVNYTLQVASAIAHASAHGVVHRDIKPSNIIITPSGRAKLVDLGLARSEHRENEADLTVAGTTLGTFDYISPEQAKDPRSVDVRSDIYSLGCTLYHLLTGEPPYPQGTVLQKLLDHSGKDAPDPRVKNRRVSPELAAIVKMMMASEPRRRYQTAEELIRDLLVVAGSLGLRSMSSEGLMWLSAQSSKDSFWERHASWLATAVGLLLIVGVLQYLGPQRDRNNNLAQQAAGVNPFDPDADLAGSPSPATSANDPTKSATSSSPHEISPTETRHPDQQPATIAGNDNSGAPATADLVGGSAEPESPGTSLVPISKTLIPGSLSDPRLVFGNGSDKGPFALSPLINDHSPGVVIGPREFQSDLLAGRTGSKHVAPETGSPTEPVEGKPTTGNPKPTDNPNPGSPVSNPAAADVTSQSSIVVVKSDGSPEQTFPTLEAACAVAQDGNVIELRFTGLRTESPLSIRNKITIRAAKGFRPVIEFVPKEIPASGYETRMMKLVGGGALDLVDVSLLMNVKAAIAADGWALVSTQRAEAVRMQRVTVTVNNPAKRPSAVVEFRGGPSRMVADMEMMNTGQMSTQLTVQLKDSMVRGGTDLFVVKTFLSARVDLENCLLALDGTVLRAQGSMDAPEKQTLLTLRLDQLTAAVNEGLIVMEGGEAPRKLGQVLVESSNNIFTTITSPDHHAAPLISMISSEPPDDLLKLLNWNGQKNFYDGFESYWIRTTLDGSKTTVWDYEEWKFRWDSKEIDPHATIVLWKKQWSGRPYAELNPSDFQLDENANGNPALSGANDGGNAGVDLSRLEKLNVTMPPETAAVSDAKRTLGDDE
ncbi:MAG: Serine/threonine protein kinaserelated protein [Planctomycetaceae bacterium]|nr:Serine/threonine protein kinaserelated protein [Planctomycetaceae bacterium]